MSVRLFRLKEGAQFALRSQDKIISSFQPYAEA